MAAEEVVARERSFRKRRLSWGNLGGDGGAEQRKESTINGAVETRRAAPVVRRPSLKFESPEAAVESLASRLNKSATFKFDGSLSVTLTPPLPSDVLGTLSYHGMEPVYISALAAEKSISKINQDRGCLVHPFMGDERSSLFCVFDGHGEDGDLVSSFVSDAILAQLATQLDIGLEPTEALKVTFHRVDAALKRERSVPSFDSGSTAIVVLRIGDTLYTACAGDSRAVVARREASTEPGERGALVALALSVDQSPDLPEEKARIEACGGFVAPPEEEGLSARVYSDSTCTVVGLAMARALGDECAKPLGIISEPVVTVHQLAQTDEFLVLASDGVWEFISSEQAVNTIASVIDQRGASVACKLLLDRAASAWKRHEGDYRDDITAIVIRTTLHG